MPAWVKKMRRSRDRLVASSRFGSPGFSALALSGFTRKLSILPASVPENLPRSIDADGQRRPGSIASVAGCAGGSGIPGCLRFQAT
jgi:hypothetical protein